MEVSVSSRGPSALVRQRIRAGEEGVAGAGDLGEQEVPGARSPGKQGVVAHGSPGEKGVGVLGGWGTSECRVQA